MFKRLTFEKKLGIDSREPKWRGLKVVAVSGLVAFLGGGIAAVGLGGVGYWIVLLGFAGGVIGMAMHLYAFADEVFRRKK